MRPRLTVRFYAKVGLNGLACSACCEAGCNAEAWNKETADCGDSISSPLFSSLESSDSSAFQVHRDVVCKDGGELRILLKPFTPVEEQDDSLGIVSDR